MTCHRERWWEVTRLDGRERRWGHRRDCPGLAQAWALPGALDGGGGSRALVVVVEKKGMVTNV
jgi:hypothetical protein